MNPNFIFGSNSTAINPVNFNSQFNYLYPNNQGRPLSELDAVTALLMLGTTNNFTNSYFIPEGQTYRNDENQQPLHQMHQQIAFPNPYIPSSLLQMPLNNNLMEMNNHMPLLYNNAANLHSEAQSQVQSNTDQTNPLTQQVARLSFDSNTNERQTSSSMSADQDSVQPRNVYQNRAEDHRYQINPQRKPKFIARPNSNSSSSGRSPDSGYSPTYDIENIFPAPMLLASEDHNPSIKGFKLPFHAQEEYERIERNSYHLKFDLTEMKYLSEHDPDIGYNASKSRLRKTYEDPAMEVKRTENNLASRRSRNKQKSSARILSVNYDYDVMENRNLYEQEQWMVSIIQEMEQVLVQEGLGTDMFKTLRNQCGLR